MDTPKDTTKYKFGNYSPGRLVYHSEEFKALCKLLGIPWGIMTENITIRLTPDRIMVTHEYPVMDFDGGRTPYDDTTEPYKEKTPKPDHKV